MYTQRKEISMKKNLMKSTVLALLLAVAVLLTGCPALDDWAYDLPGGYSIWRLNDQDIQLVKEEGRGGTTIVGRYIIAFCSDNRYIGLKRVPLPREYNGMVDIDQLDRSNPEFYLVDTDTSVVYGPWNHTEYYENIMSFGITGMCDWIHTDDVDASNE